MYYLLSVTTWDLITLGVTELPRNVKLTDKDFTLYNWQSSYESDVNTATRPGNEGPRKLKPYYVLLMVKITF